MTHDPLCPWTPQVVGLTHVTVNGKEVKTDTPTVCLCDTIHAIEERLASNCWKHEQQARSEQRSKFQPILDAWLIEGPRTDIHRAEKWRLRKSWPALAKAIENAARGEQP